MTPRGRGELVTSDSSTQPLDRPEVPFELSQAMFVLSAATAYTPTAPPFEQAKFWRPALKNDVLPTPSVATAAVALESFFDD